MTPLPDGFFERPFAHRALHGPGRPENSREAILSAVAAGYAIEVDVQRTADGTPLVFHDYELARLTGAPGHVFHKSDDQMSTLPLLGGPTHAPTLEEALDLVAGKVPLVVEIKDQDGALGPNVGPLEHEVARVLCGYAGPVAVMSFNPLSVQAMAKAAPDIPRGLVTCAFAARNWKTVPERRRKELAQVPDFDRVGASFVSHDRRDLANPALLALKQAGVPILTWTIRSAEEADEALLVADQITFEDYLA